MRTDQAATDVTPSQVVDDVYELTPLQQGILLHSLYGGDADTYIAQNSYLIEGPLDVDKMRQAWQGAVAAHPVLRTSFHWEGLDKPLQVVHQAVSVPMYQHDWTRVDPDQRDKRLERLLAEDRETGFFSLADPPLLRLHLVRLGDNMCVYVMTHHMLILDGWSEQVVVDDVMARYGQLALGGAPVPDPPQYRDYIAWLQRQDMDAARAFWSANMHEAGPGSVLAPLLPATPGDYVGPVAELGVPLPAALSSQLREVAAQHRITFNTLVFAAWALVLQRYTGERDVTFGCTSSGRPAELPGADRMAGSFINSLPVRIHVPDGGPIGDWLREVQARASAVRRYEYTPLAQIKSWAGASGPAPLFNSLVVLNNLPSDETQEKVDNLLLKVRLIHAFEKTSEPLTLKVNSTPEPTIRMIFHRDRFAAGSIERVLDDFRGALTAFAEASQVQDVVAGMTAPDAARQGQRIDYPDGESTLTWLVRRQSRLTPDAIALITEHERLTYRDLLRRAEVVAEALYEGGVGPGDIVGVCAERSSNMVTGLLGTLLAGAAYLPLEPTLPETRLRYMAQECGAKVVLAPANQVELAEAVLPHGVLRMDDLPNSPAGFTAHSARGGDAAYVMYTSGSTGQPKGVVITHAAVVNRLLWMQETFRLTQDDRILQKTPFGFDVSVWEFFWPLIVGASIVLARPSGHQDSRYLMRTIADLKVTNAHFVPSMLQLFLEEPEGSALTNLRRVICSGEQLTQALAARFKARMPGAELHNLYGPTEAAIDVTWWDCSHQSSNGSVPIGHPIANTQAYVLDRRMAECPPDVAGELYLGGVQLAREYMKRPDLTAARFVANPLGRPGARLYRTGDRVRRLPDGAIEFLGRSDHQVKIHGYRIELGEIEEILVGHNHVREAVVTVLDGATSPQLAAYVTGPHNQESADLRDYLLTRLPSYMVPATVTVLPALPLTRNGKVDRAALPDPVRQAPTDAELARPATATEARVAAAFREILGLTEFDLNTGFFDLGGDSFAAVRTVRLIQGATVSMMAAHDSVRGLASVLDEDAGAAGLLVPLARPDHTAHTLVCIPFGGGSAIAYRSLAEALGPDLAILVASLPGHELGGEPDLRPVEEVAKACVDEILDAAPDGPLSVYGHCVGSALAVEVVRLLESKGRDVERLFIGAALPFFKPRLMEAMFLRRMSDEQDADKFSYLRSLGGFTGFIADEDLSFVMRAFRHDVTEAGRYYSARWRRRGAEPLRTAITFIAGTADPETPNYERKYRDWARFTDSLDLATVPDGGHYFVQHQTVPLTAIIRSALDLHPVRETSPS